MQITPRGPDEPDVDLTVGWIEHRALRADLARFQELLTGSQTFDPKRATAVRRYLDAIVFATIRHHSIEDDLFWPLLTATTGGEVDLTPLSADHERLDALLEQLSVQASAFATDPVQGVPALAETVKLLRELLEPHLAHEEAVVFPALAKTVSQADYQNIEKAARKRFTTKDLTFLGPWLARYASTEERDRALTPSWPYKVMIALGGLSYRRLERQVFA
jgi:hemerythrin-like domain-containing protein